VGLVDPVFHLETPQLLRKNRDGAIGEISENWGTPTQAPVRILIAVAVAVAVVMVAASVKNAPKRCLKNHEWFAFIRELNVIVKMPCNMANTIMMAIMRSQSVCDGATNDNDKSSWWRPML